MTERGLAGPPVGAPGRRTPPRLRSAGHTPNGGGEYAWISESSRPRDRPVYRVEQNKPCLDWCRRRLVGPWSWTIREVLPSRAWSRGRGRGPVRPRGGGSGGGSGGGQQCHQPFELPDFPAKMAHARAVGRFQPHGGGQVAMPDRPVPQLAIDRASSRAFPGAAASHATLNAISSSERYAARGDLQIQHLTTSIDGGGKGAPPSTGR
jgi:hypothetical protein